MHSFILYTRYPQYSTVQYSPILNLSPVEANGNGNGNGGKWKMKVLSECRQARLWNFGSMGIQHLGVIHRKAIGKRSVDEA